LRSLRIGKDGHEIDSPAAISVSGSEGNFWREIQVFDVLHDFNSMHTRNSKQLFYEAPHKMSVPRPLGQALTRIVRPPPSEESRHRAHAAK